jgi:hypothetical protein
LTHLKDYVVEGTLLRTASSDFSRSCETQQDNDLLVMRDGPLAGAFEAHFDTIWAVGE